MITNHIQTRLNERLAEKNIYINPAILEQIAGASVTDTAVIIAKLDSCVGDTINSFYNRKESNGDTVILIIRNNTPVTIMFRRSDQTNTTKQLRVNLIVDMSQELKKYIH